MGKLNRRDFIQKATGSVGATWAAAAIPLGSREKLAAAQAPAVRNAQPSVPMNLKVNDHFLRLHASWCDIPDWRMAIEVGNRLLRTTDARVESVGEETGHVRFRFLKQKLIWDVQGEIDPSTNRLILRSLLHNESRNALPLRRAFLLQTDKLNGLFKTGEDVVYLPMTSGQGLNQVRSLSTKGATSDIAIQAFNQNQKKALQVGFATFLRAKTQVEHTREASSLALKAWCDFDGWELQPGASTPTETLTLAVGEDPHSQLEAWSDLAARVCSIRPREWASEANGWVGGTWSRHTVDIERYEDYILRNAKAIHQRLQGYGINYVWESIGNLKDGQPGDWLSWNTENFPDGHRYLHDELEQLGFKWGLWCGAFMLSSKLQNKVDELWDALFKQPDGKQPMVYMKAWGYGLKSRTENFRNPVYALDPSHPKTLAFLRKVFRTYRERGVRYYMIDFLWAGADTLGKIPHAKHYDKTLVSGPEVFQKGLQAIRDACGDETYLLASTGPTYHTAGAMDSVRTGNDFGEGRTPSPAFPTYPGTYAMMPPTYWSGPVHALTNQASSYHTHRRLYVNDSGNVLTVDKPLQLNQAQVYATIHVLSGGPSMLGDDFSYIEDERLSLIKKTLPRPKDVAVPVDLFTRRKQGYPRVYHRKVVNSWGSYDVVAVYNLETTEPIKQDVELESLKLDKTRQYHVWEFWNVEYVGKVRGRLSVEVPPYTVKVFRLTEDTGTPVILGTDMHVLMGEAEIDRCAWDSNHQGHSGRALRPAGESGSVYLYSPPDLGVANPRGLFLGRDFDHDCLVIRCPLRFEKGWAEWNVKFSRLKVSVPSRPLF